MDPENRVGAAGTHPDQSANASSGLEGSEAFVRAVLESAAQAILGVNREGRIVIANRRAEELFGYSRRELSGAAIELLLPEETRSRHSDHRAAYLRMPWMRPMGVGMDLAGRRKDGTEFPVEVSLSYAETEQGMFAIAFVTDITQRITLQQQLIQAQKMEAIGRLAGGVAHDFNNMLTIIAGYDRMILDKLPAADPLRPYAEEILKAADRAGGLTNQLLVFSRRQVMRPRTVPVNDLLSSTEKMLQRLIGDDIELDIRLAPDAGSIKADPSSLEQSILHIATNAREAMRSGGRLTIETSNIRLDETYAKTHLGVTPGEYVMIAVSDTGHGMDEETLRHIFEPFFTTKQKGKGTGLGLATVYGIVKQIGGEIWVYSEPAQGTTFKLYFPRLLDAASSGGAEPVIPKYHGTETVLVVEDEQGVRELIVAILEQLGYRVLTAQHGREAVQVSDSHRGPIHLLLSDIVMPHMTGKQLADRLRTSRPDMMVLFLSGYTENTAVDRGSLAPNSDFLSKPFTREALARKLREMLDAD